MSNFDIDSVVALGKELDNRKAPATDASHFAAALPFEYNFVRNVTPEEILMNLNEASGPRLGDGAVEDGQHRRHVIGHDDRRSGGDHRQVCR
jgi:hypothetical protein